MKPLEPTIHPPTNDSPCAEYDWRQACPRCAECGRPIDEDRGCQDEDCLAERGVGSDSVVVVGEPVETSAFR